MTTPKLPTGAQHCPTCHGDGLVTDVVPGGRWDAHFGNWLPLEHEVPCPTCYGHGIVYPEDDNDR